MKPKSPPNIMGSLLMASLVLMSFATTALAGTNTVPTASDTPGGSTFFRQCDDETPRVIEPTKRDAIVKDCVRKKCVALHPGSTDDARAARFDCMHNAGYGDMPSRVDPPGEA